jgi:hypothetical protein
MEKIIRNTSEEDFKFLIKFYLYDIENHQERAVQFAKDLIYSFKTIICVSGEEILGCIT